MAARRGPRGAAELRAALGHPVIDTDGHLVEFMPVFEEYLAEFGGARAVEHYRRGKAWFAAAAERRQADHLAKPPWGYPVDTEDHLTSMLPALLEERLGELGMDYVVLHPSPKRIGVPHLADDALRQPLCRALNAYTADLVRPHAEHLTATAVIPMHTPVEAIEELEYAVHTLGMKTSMVASYVTRQGATATIGRAWWDNLALDSAYDYDPVWEAFQRLGVVPAFHSGSIGLGSRISWSNSLYNFIGHFAESQASIAKALVLGGVTRRFPDLPFAFETAGVTWAATMFADLVDLWAARNGERVRRNDPVHFDLGRAREAFERYASFRLKDRVGDLATILDRMSWLSDADLDHHLDEFAAARVSEANDFVERFARRCYFGCEGSDRFTFLAFARDVLPFETELKPIFATDMGHFTSTPMDELLPTAHRAVEDGRLCPDDFRALTFANPVEMFTTANPDFFVGTAVEKHVVDEGAR
jgi:predicted TIM-barrel fold metal-dependent hydrolase